MATKNQNPNEVTVKISLDVSEDTPVYYANYVEVGNNQFDFGLTFVRVPIKLPTALQTEMQANGTLSLNADLQVILPRAVVVGLIEALKKQLELQ